jgi:ERF superfamily.
MTEDHHLKILEAAIAQKCDTEAISTIINFIKDEQRRVSRDAFYASLTKFQAKNIQVPRIKVVKVTTKKGFRYQYNYAPLSVIIDAVSEALAECGFSYIFDCSHVSATDNASTDDVMLVTCILQHVCGYSVSSRFSVPIDASDHMSGSHSSASAYTYGKRYAFCGVTGLVTSEDDDDGNGAGSSKVESVGISAEKLQRLEDFIAEVKISRSQVLQRAGTEDLSTIDEAMYESLMARLRTYKAKLEEKTS